MPTANRSEVYRHVIIALIVASFTDYFLSIAKGYMKAYSRIT